ncbi:MAG: 50S ribosomal protein L11 methyltransferase [Candidatus Electrothrix sp. AR3]|nr:50S ribosomal protein L11 methyltransferase [Candidatus Electrothrix sp. AR3]
MSNSKSLNWLKASFYCPEQALDAAGDLLGILSGSGVEQAPAKEGMIKLTGFFHLEQKGPQEEIMRQIEKEMTNLFDIYGFSSPKPQYSLFADEDWATSWQQFFTPFAIIPGLIIKPSWDTYLAAPNEQVLEIDPGRAFGTGQHASTKLALSLIHDCFQASLPKRVLDIGTGTGILSMAAGLFGAEQITAIDNDPDAVRIAGENIVQNNLEAKVTASATDLKDITGSFNLICANIIHDVLVTMAPTIAQLLAVKGSIVLAGILAGEQEHNIAAVYSRLNLTLQQTVYEDEWASLLLTA